jgi:hypothetical protein
LIYFLGNAKSDRFRTHTPKKELTTSDRGLLGLTHPGKNQKDGGKEVMTRGKLIVLVLLASCVAFSAAAETKKLTLDNVVSLKGLDLGEEAILKKITDSGTTFTAEDLEKLKKAGFSEDFMSKVQQFKSAEPQPQPKKLSPADVLSLKDLEMPEASILKKIQDSGTTFTPEQVEELKKAGFSEDFIGKLTVQPAEKVKEPDLKAASEKFRTDMDEMGDRVLSAAEALKKFMDIVSKSESLKKQGILSDEEFTQSLDKAGKTCAQALEENHAKALELKQAIDAAPEGLKERQAGVELASLGDQYLATMKGAFKQVDGAARGTAPAEEPQKAKDALNELKTKVEDAYKAYEAITEEEEEEKVKEKKVVEKEKKVRPPRKRVKKEEEEVVEKGLVGSWQLRAPGASVDLTFVADGSYTWHAETAMGVEDLTGTWKKINDFSVQIQGQGELTPTLLPCQLITENVMQIAVQGVVLQFQRVEEKAPGRLKKTTEEEPEEEEPADEADFSSPEAAVETFIRACEDNDLDLISECFSEKAAEQFDSVRDKSISSRELGKLTRRFKGGKIGATDEISDTSASVDVRPKGGGDIEVVILYKEDDEWKIGNF